MRSLRYAARRDHGDAPGGRHPLGHHRQAPGGGVIATDEESVFQIPEAVRRQVAEAEEGERRDREEAFAAGRQAAARRAGYHDPSQSRLEDEPEPEPRARTTDPPTSHEAARSVVRVTERQQAVLALLRDLGPMTDEKLLIEYRRLWSGGAVPGQSDSGIRTRRHELVDAGRVEQVGEERLPSGRMAIVWGSKDARDT